MHVINDKQRKPNIKQIWYFNNKQTNEYLQLKVSKVKWRVECLSYDLRSISWIIECMLKTVLTNYQKLSIDRAYSESGILILSNAFWRLITYFFKLIFNGI